MSEAHDDRLRAKIRSNLQHASYFDGTGERRGECPRCDQADPELCICLVICWHPDCAGYIA